MGVTERKDRHLLRLELEGICRLHFLKQESIQELIIQVQRVRTFLDDHDSEVLQKLEYKFALEK